MRLIREGDLVQSHEIGITHVSSILEVMNKTNAAPISNIGYGTELGVTIAMFVKSGEIETRVTWCTIEVFEMKVLRWRSGRWPKTTKDSS